jgi:thiamine biosynthesis lipoprotein
MIALAIIGGIPAERASADPQPEQPALHRFEFEQIRFAAPARLTFYAPSEEVANKLSKAVFDRLREIDRIMSDYDPDSELSQLCASGRPGTPIRVSEELWSILNSAQEFSQKTEGAFDVSVGPVVRLWRISRRTRRLPEPEAIRAAIEKVDWKSIVLDEKDQTVELARPGMQIDLGGIGQGYAADEAFRILKVGGVTRALVDISGDIRVGDPPPGQAGWRIEIEPLKRGESKTTTGVAEQPQVLLLANAAVSTSGDAYQFVEIDGVRYSHIVDPKTGIGLPSSHSVTLIAPDATTADALATALCLLGPEKGQRLLTRFPETAARFARVVDGELTVTDSPGFNEYVMSSEAGK